MSGVANGLSVVMPNYNGEALLAANLPPLIKALQHWGGVWEIIVVDDASRDGSVALLQSKFPDVQLVCNGTNRGFSATCNRGMQMATCPLALCINTDVLVEDDFVAPLLEHFHDSSVFAVTPNIIAAREGKNQGIVHGMFSKGFLKGGFGSLEERSPVRENLYAVGACVVYDLEKFKALGGYAELYTPYLFEDVDIAYRAWKRGWKSMYDPRSTVHHFSSATISNEGKRRKRIIYFRNRFLFHWVNLTDPTMVALHFLHVGVRLMTSFLWGDLNYYKSFFLACGNLKKVVALRQNEKIKNNISDLLILKRTA